MAQKKKCNRFYPYLKRVLDFLLAFFALIFFSPVILLIWLIIKCSGKGEAIYSQERIGYKGKPFSLHKFRTMKVNAESQDHPQLCQNDDKRLTKIGKFLRQHHLDEFPQLWNVLKGDMSFVGYRPERVYFIKQIMKKNQDYVLLYRIRPGLFSEATLYNGYTDTLEKMLIRLELDLKYLEKQSFSFDLKIIVLTSFFILTGKKF